MSLQKKLPSPFSSKFRRFNERPGGSVSKYKYQKFTGTMSLGKNWLWKNLVDENSNMQL